MRRHSWKTTDVSLGLIAASFFGLAPLAVHAAPIFYTDAATFGAAQPGLASQSFAGLTQGIHANNLAVSEVTFSTQSPGQQSSALDVYGSSIGNNWFGDTLVLADGDRRRCADRLGDRRAGRLARFGADHGAGLFRRDAAGCQDRHGGVRLLRRGFGDVDHQHHAVFRLRRRLLDLCQQSFARRREHLGRERRSIEWRRAGRDGGRSRASQLRLAVGRPGRRRVQRGAVAPMPSTWATTSTGGEEAKVSRSGTVCPCLSG